MSTSSSKRSPSSRPAARGREVSSKETAPGESRAIDGAKAAKRIKVIRDSFTMPLPDYERIVALKKRSLALGQEKKKSEMLRAGLRALERLEDEDLVAVLASIEPVKTGRPPNDAKKARRRARAKN